MAGQERDVAYHIVEPGAMMARAITDVLAFYRYSRSTAQLTPDEISILEKYAKSEKRSMPTVELEPEKRPAVSREPVPKKPTKLVRPKVGPKSDAVQDLMDTLDSTYGKQGSRW
ncbi:MAG: hypothetical protein WC241_04905 [Candidatus Paceibacterota bacterium]|jgi:hypothetical protein